ncbi:MAG: cysteine dioxygenase [Pseudomonadales bacterium]
MNAPVKPAARLSNLIAALESACDEQDYARLIAEADLKVEDLVHYRFLPDMGYGRNLIYSSETFEMILMCWPDRQQSAVHDHAKSLCVMKCIEGELVEHRYRVDADMSPKHIGETVLQGGDLQQIDNSQGLHSIQNRSGELSCSLHFYFPAIHSCHLFCEETGQKKQVFSLFTSEYGIRC